MFTQLYPDLDYGTNQIIWLFSWVGAVYSEDELKGHYLLENLMGHPDRFTRQHAEFLMQLALKKESGSVEITYWLEPNPFTNVLI